MYSSCRDIRAELATIVIWRQKSKCDEVKAANKAKSALRDKLLRQLEAHNCSD